MLPDRYQTNDFFVCDIFGVSAKDDLATMEHPIFSLSTKPDKRVLSYSHNGVDIQVVPSVKGRATIYDKDILIFCISQLVAALNAGKEISRTLSLRAHDLLVATNRDTGGESYVRLREAFERLAGTRVTTNIITGDTETTSGFGLIENWEILRRSRGGRMINVTVTLSEWLYRAVCARSILTLSRDYFRLRKPLERRIYELARKHCGRQAEWVISISVLHHKSGSSSPLRVFRAAMRKMIDTNHLPDYVLEEREGDLIAVLRRKKIGYIDQPILSEDALRAVRDLRPDLDVYALQARWLSWWEQTGKPRISRPDQAFVAWVKTQKA